MFSFNEDKKKKKNGKGTQTKVGVGKFMVWLPTQWESDGLSFVSKEEGSGFRFHSNIISPRAIFWKSGGLDLLVSKSTGSFLNQRSKWLPARGLQVWPDVSWGFSKTFYGPISKQVTWKGIQQVSLVFYAAATNYHGISILKQHKFILTVQEVRSLKSGCQQACVPSAAAG